MLIFSMETPDTFLTIHKLLIRAVHPQSLVFQTVGFYLKQENWGSGDVQWYDFFFFFGLNENPVTVQPSYPLHSKSFLTDAFLPESLSQALVTLRSLNSEIKI